MSKTLSTLCLLSTFALSGCGGLFLSKEERALRRRSLDALSRVGVLGASLSAGFGTGRTLADILDVSLRPEHRLLDAADAEFFRDALSRGEKAIGQLKAGGPTLVIGLDWLFWFAYGEKTAEKRRQDLAAGLELVERLDCPLFLGDLPDVTGAAESMLPPRLISPPGEISELNRVIGAWAEAHPAARVLPLSVWTRLLREGKPISIGGREVVLKREEILQEDLLHPSEQGQVLLAVLCLEAVKEKLGGLVPGDFVLDRERLRSRIDSQPCAVSIEVVDGDGAPVRNGTLRFDVVGFSMSSLSNLQLLRLARYAYLRDPQPLPDGQPFQLLGIPSFADRGTYSVRAEAPGMTPSEEVTFRLLPGKTTRLRLVLTKPERLELVVRDGGTGNPLPVARAISVTEVKARGLDSTESLEKGGPGAGAADAEGRLVLGDLRPGVHDLEVHAPGYQTVRLEKVPVGPGTPVEARLCRARSPGAVSVVVRGPAGDPLAGVRVSLGSPDSAAGQALRSGPDGRVRFEGVPPGRYFAGVDFGIVLAGRRANQVAGYPFRNRHTFRLEEGEEAAVEVGYITGSASVTVRVMEGERPLEGVWVFMCFDPPDLETWIPQRSTGSAGAVTFPGLRPGRYRAQLKKDQGGWWFESWEVRGAGVTERSLDLGRARIRGKILRNGRGAQGSVAATGPGGRSAFTEAAGDGSFEFPCAVPGPYHLETPGSPPIDVEVPPSGDPPPVEIPINEAGRG